MKTRKKTWKHCTTVGELIKQVNEIRDVDPDTPLQCFCEDTIVFELWEDVETGEQHLEIETP